MPVSLNMASLCCDTSVSDVYQELSIYVVTWNMNGKVAYDDLVSLVTEKKYQRYDFYVIGLQEAPPKAKNFASVLEAVLGHRYSLLGRSTLQSLQLFVFSRKSHQRYITGLRIDKIKGKGFGGMVGKQKGAVGIAFKFMATSFLFISCHLPPHEKQVEHRNYHYQKISQSMFSRRSKSAGCIEPLLHYACTKPPEKEDCHQETEETFSTESSDVVLWIGDLNYRIERSRRSVSRLIDQNRQHSLRASDQLCKEAERGEIFNGFCEGPLSFRPTYKYDIGSDIYDTSPKERVPSWTDRILYKINPASAISAHLEDYDRIDSIKVSDHRPVKAVLKLTRKG